MYICHNKMLQVQLVQSFKFIWSDDIQNISLYDCIVN